MASLCLPFKHSLENGRGMIGGGTVWRMGQGAGGSLLLHHWHFIQYPLLPATMTSSAGSARASVEFER